MQTLIQSTQPYRLLRTQMQTGRFSHAYLLQMDDARNLRATLKTFAKLLFNCENAQTEREKIRSGRIDDEQFSDCLFYPEPGKKFMVEDAERLTEEATLNPVESDKKVFVISDFAEANAASQNKLLKLLEEPPENVIFLLGTTSIYPVLTTVLSRVVKLEIPLFGEKEIISTLQRIYAQKYPLSDIELCATASGGSLGAAQNMLEGGEYKPLLDAAFALCLATGSTLPPLIKKIGETPYKKQLLFLLRLVYRDACVFKTQKKADGLLLRSERQRLNTVAEKYLLSSLLYAQAELTQAEKDLAFNAVFPQLLEITLSKILLQNAKNIRKQR